MPQASTPSPPAPAEAELVAHAKELRPEAWDTLYDTYYPKMYSYLYVHLGDRTAAEDLASDVFEQAWRGIHRFQYRGVPLSSWLYRIAHNVMVDHLKRRRRAPASLDSDGVPALAGPDAADRVGLRDMIRRAMSRLTREQQQVVVLRHVEGHDVATSARIMGKKENALRALEFRALHSLRRIMEREAKGSR